MPDHPETGARIPSADILAIMDDTFDYPAHRVVGSSAEAFDWTGRSSLPEEDKTALLAFVDRFPGAAFYRDDAVLLDQLERRNAVTLPPWLREIRQVLAGPGPDAHIRFDGFDYLGPRTDRTDDDGFIDLWYEDNFFGYLQEEDRDLLRSGAECYPILCATTSANHLLAADLGDPENRHVLDLCDEDIMDNRYAGIPGTESVHPAFESYASMLSHIVECRAKDGTVTRARGLS